MGLVGGRPSRMIEDTIDEDAREIVRDVGDFLERRARHHTPVAERPAGADRDDWTAGRGGRRPGTLRDAWETGPVERAGDDYTIEVRNPRTEASYVELPTPPHRIEARPGGTLRFVDRRTGQPVFARSVDHPGTRGAFMLRTALEETDAAALAIAAETLARRRRR